MSTSGAHAVLIARLRALSQQSWSTLALLACLDRLASGGPTDGRLIGVHDAWPLDPVDGISVIYSHPHAQTVGVRVLRTSPVGHPLYLNAHGGADVDSPEEFGAEVADFIIAEPLGAIADQLTYDSDGVGWWGEPPFPLGSPERSR